MGFGAADWAGFAGARAIGEAERAAVLRVLERRTLYRGAGLQPPEEVEALERELAAQLGQRHAVALNSGTSALDAALRAVGVQAGDEVVVAGYGWWTDVTVPRMLGAVPVLAPVGADLNLDPEGLEACLSPRTRAIVSVDACGLPCDLQEIARIAGARGIPIIDDACQALGASPVGVGATATLLSLQAFKIVTAGEGGALLTNDQDVYRAAVRFHDAGLARFATVEPDGEPLGIGLNLRMSELSAALGRVQLGRLEELTQRLRTARRALMEALAPVILSGLAQPRAVRAGVIDNGTFVVLNTATAPAARALAQALAQLSCPALVASEDRLHSAPGWVEIMTREGVTHRAVELARSQGALERTVTLTVNWQWTQAQLEQVHQAARMVANHS